MAEGPLAHHQAILGSSLTPPQKLTLFALHSHWSQSRPAVFPSVPRLARLTSLSERTVRRAVAELEAIGVLVVTRRHGQSNTHVMQFDALPQHPGHDVTPDTVSPLTERQATPATVSGSPRSPWPPKRSSEEIKRREPEVLSPKVTSSRGQLEPIPDSWTPLDRHRERAALRGVNIEVCARSFRNHARSIDRRCADWSSAFDEWIEKQHQEPRSKDDSNVWDMGPDDISLPQGAGGAPRMVRRHDGSVSILTP